MSSALLSQPHVQAVLRACFMRCMNTWCVSLESKEAILKKTAVWRLLLISTVVIGTARQVRKRPQPTVKPFGTEKGASGRRRYSNTFPSASETLLFWSFIFASSVSLLCFSMMQRNTMVHGSISTKTLFKVKKQLLFRLFTFLCTVFFSTQPLLSEMDSPGSS